MASYNSTKFHLAIKRIISYLLTGCVQYYKNTILFLFFGTNKTSLPILFDTLTASEEWNIGPFVLFSTTKARFRVSSISGVDDANYYDDDIFNFMMYNMILEDRKTLTKYYNRCSEKQAS